MRRVTKRVSAVGDELAANLIDGAIPQARRLGVPEDRAEVVEAARTQETGEEGIGFIVMVATQKDAAVTLVVSMGSPMVLLSRGARFSPSTYRATEKVPNRTGTFEVARKLFFEPLPFNDFDDS